MEKANKEAERIAADLKRLAARADFPIEVLPVEAVDTDAKAEKAAATDCDILLVFPAGGWTVYKIAESKTPKVVFIRHKSGPYYLGHEVFHWRVLRHNGDNFSPIDITVNDVVVDKYDEVLWRLRSLFGLKNAKGTKMLAIGGLVAYCPPGQECGPPHAKDVWGYEFESISVEDFTKRLEAARANQRIVATVERQTKHPLAAERHTGHRAEVRLQFIHGPLGG